MYVIMGLTHLREWIAPGYSHEKPARTYEEVFYNEIYKLESFRLIQALCNHSKHMKSSPVVTSTTHVSMVDDWKDVDSVGNFDLGPVCDYSAAGRNLMVVIAEIISYYDRQWFSRKQA